MSQYRDLCAAADIREGQARMFVMDETMICVVRLADEYFALSDICPHAGASLAHGYVEHDVIHCRIHHWRFCIRDGRYLDEDKPTSDLKTYAIRLVGDRIQVRL
ncbi:MAG: Rieske 2Fe-2S domain-containing protein [Planctomycetaceae bacterium]|nr:Rieske 2Fe-2S domain-containing protein [Planctomycetaceae bacterium]